MIKRSRKFLWLLFYYRFHKSKLFYTYNLSLFKYPSFKANSCGSIFELFKKINYSILNFIVCHLSNQRNQARSL